MAWNVILGSPIGIVGMLGLVFILVAWIPETLTTIRTKKVGMRREFIFLYLFGSLFLTLHSIILEDFVFTVLNAVATIMAFINLYYSLVYGKKGKERSRKGY